MNCKTIDFKKFTSIHIGPKKKVLIIDEIKDYEDFVIIGKGSNLLISSSVSSKFAMLCEQFDYIIQRDDKLIVGAATTSSKLLRYCQKHNIANMEFLAKIPGTIGGLTKMNAGLKQWEIFNQINSIRTHKGIIKKQDIKYSYRYTNISDIIFEVIFNIEYGYDKKLQIFFNNLRKNQPNIASAGSCFKNPKEHSAGYLIEKVGLKGYKIGNMAFSDIHANFLVNLGGGTYDEAIKLIKLAQQKVKKEFDIELELEIVVLN